MENYYLLVVDGNNKKKSKYVPKPIITENDQKGFSLDTIKSVIINRIHILQWLPRYSKSDVISDFIAGLTVGLTMIPQSIAYASLAGLPAQYGLYTAFIGSITYVFFGTIKEVSIGPTTLMSMLTFGYTSAQGLGIDYVILLTFLVGCVEMLMGVLKLGFLVEFISPCVTSGFTSSMAVVMTVSQFKNLFGLTRFNNHDFIIAIKQLFSRYKDIRIPDTIMGVSCIIFLFVLKQLPRIKGSRILRRILFFISISRNILIVLITTIIAFYYQEYAGGAPFLLSGEVPSGLPALRPPKFSTQDGNNDTVTFTQMVNSLGTGILIVPVTGVLANVAIAKAFANGVVVDATQEMITLGLCNIFGSFIQAMPSCGAFTRSAVASSSDVKTPLQGIYSGAIIIMALSFLTPYFYYIPKTTLGAILISAVITLFDYEIFPRLWRCNKFDFWLTVATLAAGTFLGLEMAIMCGGALNLIVLCKAWARPDIIKEIRSDEKGVDYIYIKPELGLYYPGIDYFSTSVTKAHNLWPQLSITIDCANVIKIDYSACEMLNNLINSHKKKASIITLINLNPEVAIALKANNEKMEDDELEKFEIPLLVIERKASYCGSM